jgi:DNA-directed RNA polymerase specialized sigma24 family protein
MRDDGDLRGQGQFPATRWSLIVAARSAVPKERQRALEILTAAYWKPVYKYIRLRWDKDNEQAQDLTQDFFLRILDKISRALRPAPGPPANFSACVRGPLNCQ